MKPGHLTLVSADEPVAFDEQASIDQASIDQHTLAPHEAEFREQQQKIQRLNAYYDDVVAELRALLDESEEGGWIRPGVEAAPSAGE
jgi:hypothetical protein